MEDGNLSRRRLLRLGAGLLGICTAGGDTLMRHARAVSSTPGDLLSQPELRTSRGGLLDTSLRASVNSTTVNGRQVTMSLYESSLPGPVLRVRPGDRLRLRLFNDLDPTVPFLCPLPNPAIPTDDGH